MTPPPSRKGRPSAISSIGLTGAPSSAASVASSAQSPQVDDMRRLDVETPQRQDTETSGRLDFETSQRPDVETSERQDVSTSRRQDAKTSRRQDVKTASDDGTVAFTLRLTADEALDLDTLQLEFRRVLRRRVDKAGIFRTLLVLAADDPDLRNRVTDRLQRHG